MCNEFHDHQAAYTIYCWYDNGVVNENYLIFADGEV